MNSQKVLITGAGGELGRELITKLSRLKKYKIVALDKNKLDNSLKPLVNKFIQGDILNKALLQKIFTDNNFDIVFHLAAILSTSAEKDPEKAHEVNVEGSCNLLTLANSKAQEKRKEIIFFFPSSIAVYGMPDLSTKRKARKVKETQYLNPITIYGINKLYIENFGNYLSTNYQLLSNNKNRFFDFRCIRFPGLISACTVPTGGTSDYAPEMIHAAIQTKPYECFVRPDTKIPFMTMPDAAHALVQLTKVSKNKLTQNIYNVGGFSVTAKEIEEKLIKTFPKLKVTYKVDKPRQKIVDSWPKDVNDSLAKKDWGWKAKYNFHKAFGNYLLPVILNSNKK